MHALLAPLYRLPGAGTRLLRARFARDVAVVSLGAAAAQALSVLAAPLLTRIYGPQDFGLFGTVATVSATLATVACLKYETAVLLESDEDDAAAAIVAGGLVAALCTAILALAALIVPLVSDNARLAAVLGWSVPLVAMGGIAFLGNNWATRQRRFSGLALYQIARSGGGVVFQIVFAAMALGGVGLIAGQLCGQLAGVLALLVPMARDLSGRRLWPTQALPVTRVLRKHRALALYSTPQTLTRALLDNLPVMVLGAVYAIAESGWFWLAQRILMLPSLLIAESLRPVFFQRAAELRRNGDSMLRLFGLTTAGLAAICAPVVLILVIAGPDLFSLVFGEAWRPAGHYARILAPAWWVQLAAVPSSVMFQILGRQKAFLIFDASMLGAGAAAMAFGVATGGPAVAVSLYVVASTVGHLALIAFVAREVLRDNPDALADPSPA